MSLRISPFSATMAHMIKNEHTEQDAPKKLYELSYLLVSTVPEDKLSEEVATIKGAIEGAGGVIETSADPSLRDLAYPMSLSKEHKKTTYTAGYFGWMVFHAESDAMKAIEKALDAHDRVLRYLLINRPPMAAASIKAKAPGVGPRKEKKEADEADIDKSIEELVEEKVAA
jgi:ribosomal protein S6